jgi:hypothetical protein
MGIRNPKSEIRNVFGLLLRGNAIR